MPDSPTPTACRICGRQAEFVVLVWRDLFGVRRDRYCASWVSPACFAAYEEAAHALGY